MKSKEKMQKNKVLGEEKGFTLVELLLVIAIIGILAGTIMVGISGQRQRSRVASATESLRSVMPYVVDCYMNEGLTEVENATPGGSVCSTGLGSITYPGLDDDCSYVNDEMGSGKLKAECGPAGSTTTIVCDFTGKGNCKTQ